MILNIECDSLIDKCMIILLKSFFGGKELFFKVFK